jgi:hypothetical protein
LPIAILLEWLEFSGDTDRPFPMLPVIQKKPFQEKALKSILKEASDYTTYRLRVNAKNGWRFIPEFALMKQRRNHNRLTGRVSPEVLLDQRKTLILTNTKLTADQRACQNSIRC